MERDREKYDPSFVGYDQSRIWPFGIDKAVVLGSRPYQESGLVIWWPGHGE